MTEQERFFKIANDFIEAVVVGAITLSVLFLFGWCCYALWQMFHHAVI